MIPELFIFFVAVIAFTSNLSDPQTKLQLRQNIVCIATLESLESDLSTCHFSEVHLEVLDSKRWTLPSYQACQVFQVLSL